MGKWFLWRAWIVAALALLAVPNALTAWPGGAPLRQDQPTPTPEPTAVRAEVAARVLVVRAGASSEWVAIGGLNEGETITPLGLSPDGDWVMIKWEGRQGWVSADYVEWGAGVDPAALPTVLPPTPAPRTPTLPPTQTASPSASATPAALTPTPSRTPTLTLTRTPIRPPSATPSPESVPSATLTPTLGQAAMLPPAPTPTGTAAGPRAAPSRIAFPPTLIGGAGVGMVLVAVLYGWRLGRGRRELRRYAGGFVLESCPVCRRGHLRLEEQVRRPLGVPYVRRTVRCDACRSVMRQIRPGVWRYTIDPYANPELAETRNAHVLTDEALVKLARRAETYQPEAEPERSPAASPGFEDAVEHLVELEAQVIASQQDSSDGGQTDEIPQIEQAEPAPEADGGDEDVA